MIDFNSRWLIGFNLVLRISSHWKRFSVLYGRKTMEEFHFVCKLRLCIPDQALCKLRLLLNFKHGKEIPVKLVPAYI
jgi:hypothetical protein